MSFLRRQAAKRTPAVPPDAAHDRSASLSPDGIEIVHDIVRDGKGRVCDWSARARRVAPAPQGGPPKPPPRASRMVYGPLREAPVSATVFVDVRFVGSEGSGSDPAQEEE